jgi:hypothetical protein
VAAIVALSISPRQQGSAGSKTAHAPNRQTGPDKILSSAPMLRANSMRVLHIADMPTGSFVAQPPKRFCRSNRCPVHMRRSDGTVNETRPPMRRH